MEVYDEQIRPAGDVVQWVGTENTRKVMYGNAGEIDGFTQAQRFFIAAAQVWREKIRPEYLQTLVQSDEHAPAIARATVPAENMDAFYEAFPDIVDGTPTYLAPEDRVVIW